MDIVYILGIGSSWENNEIRFSLRSIEKNISDLGNVFVIGERPPWLKNVFHIPAIDPYKTKWKNGAHKISIACREEKISEDFLLMNDDFFIVQKIKASDYPFYYDGMLSKVVKSTAHYIKNKKSSLHKFAIHRPFPINKKKFLALPPMPYHEEGFSVRDFYGNYYGEKGTPSRDPLLSPLKAKKDYDAIAEKYSDFSIFTATARSPLFQKWIKEQFPEPSRYEMK
jgi:hypothetical protein